MLKPIEERIKEYIDNFYEDDKDLATIAKFQKLSIKDDTIVDSLEYKTICASVFNLLKNTNLTNKYRIEIDKSCTSLIQKLFNTYVDDSTFVITSSHDHKATTSLLKDKNQYIVNLFRLQDKQERIKIFQEMLAAFKKSKCTNIFCMMVGTTPHSAIVIDQDFFIELKNMFVKNSLPHLMFLDDCQGIFILERNYEIFDGFLATGHVLSHLFPDVGLLFTKLPQKIGYLNKQTLIDLYNKIKIIVKYKDKAKNFNALINEYFAGSSFEQYTNEASHQFALSLRNTINNPKYDNKFIKYGIRFNPINCEDNFVRLRYHEVIIQDPDVFIKGLHELKTHLNKLSRFKELAPVNLNYSLESREEMQNLNLDSNITLNKKIKNLLTFEQQKLIQQRFYSLYIQKRTK